MTDCLATGGADREATDQSSSDREHDQKQTIEKNLARMRRDQ